MGGFARDQLICAPLDADRRIDEEAWLAAESGGTLLNFTGEDFEVIGEEVSVKCSVYSWIFECVLGAISTG